MFIPNWFDLCKADRDKILAARHKLGLKLGKGGKGGSYTSSSSKNVKNLKRQNNKFKRQIKALKRLTLSDGEEKDGDYTNGDPDESSDAGDAFGGRRTKRVKVND